MRPNIHPDFPPVYTDRLPIEASLEYLGFKASDNGPYVRRWSGLVFEVGAGLWGYFLLREGVVRRRKAWPPHEVTLPPEIAPIDLMASIYQLWAEVFEGEDPPDMPLLWGRQWLEYRQDMKRLVSPPPTLWVDRPFLRFVLTHLEHENDWVEEDYEIRLSQVSGQLRLHARGHEVFCPAHGHWVDTSVVSARELFRCLPKRFMRPIIPLVQREQEIQIGRQVIPARWEEVGGQGSGESDSLPII